MARSGTEATRRVSNIRFCFTPSPLFALLASYFTATPSLVRAVDSLAPDARVDCITRRKPQQTHTLSTFTFHFQHRAFRSFEASHKQRIHENSYYRPLASIELRGSADRTRLQIGLKMVQIEIWGSCQCTFRYNCVRQYECVCAELLCVIWYEGVVFGDIIAPR